MNTTRRALLYACLAVAAIVSVNSATASEPVYSLDILSQHPYRFTPAYGHASQNPGSPKWFVPGYGYRIPGFGYSVNLTSEARYYHQVIPSTITTQSRMYWEQGRSPWYLPGTPPTAPFPLGSTAW